MTLEELLECSATQLQAMSDKELEAHLSKYFIVTRPERQIKEAKISHTNPMAKLQSAENDAKMKRAAAIAKSFGIELGL